MEFGPALRRLWRFGDGVVYLNHGGFGATPGEVLDVQAALRDRIESAPGPFLTHEYPGLIREAAGVVARWLGARGEDLAFTDNATTGVNAVLRSPVFGREPLGPALLGPGDEVLVTATTYGAVRNAARFAAEAGGAAVTVVELPFPADGPDAVVAAVLAAVTPRTRLAIIDHVVSETALVLPVAALCAALRARGVAVLVDGAHAPGQVPLDLATLGADWYAANLHKWAFAPRGCGILWAAPDRRAGLHPPVISWGLDQGFTAEFDWVGTRDPTPWLAAPAGLAFLARLGAERLRARNRALVLEAGRMLANAWGEPAPAPEGMVGCMLLVPLPGGRPGTRAAADTLRRALWHGHRIEVPVIPLAGRLWARISAQAYNGPEDYARLAAAVPAALAATAGSAP